MKYLEFIDQLVNLFPQIKEEIMDKDDMGNITMQMGTFNRFTQKAIDENDIPTVEKCFEFISLNNSRVNDRIQNSIGITYLAKLRIRKNSKIEKMLPQELKNIRVSLKNHYESMAKDEGFKKFLNDLKKDLKQKK